MHSSRMHTARSLTVSPSMLCWGGGGACAWSWGGCLVLGGVWSRRGAYLVLGGCLPGPGGGAWSSPGGCGIPACTEAEPPLPL